MTILENTHTPEPLQPKQETLDLAQFSNTVDFKKDLDSCLKELAQNKESIKNNFKLALMERLLESGYEGDLKAFWEKELANNGCKKIKVENETITFWKTEKKDGKTETLEEITPTFSSIPIKIDLTRFRPTTRRTEHYNPDNGLITLNAKDTRTVKLRNIIMFARAGVEVEVTSKGKKPRKAIFDENLDAYYTDGPKEIVKIFNGDKVMLAQTNAETPKATPAEETLELNRLPNAGTYFFKKGEKSPQFVGRDANTIIEEALHGPTITEFLIVNEGLKKLREMGKQGYDTKTYTDFLRKNNAIKSDRITLIIDTSFKSKAELEASQKKQQEQTNKEKAEAEMEKNKYYIPYNFTRNLTFQISDPKLVEAIKTPDKWNDAWAHNTIEGLNILKHIVETNPIFGDYAKKPDSLRSRLQQVASSGEITFEDFIDKILPPQLLPGDTTGQKLSYSRLQDIFKNNFDTNGTPRPEFPQADTDQIRNIIIGGNQFLLQLQQLKYTETTEGKGGYHSLRENRTAVLAEPGFKETINDLEKWQQEWKSPTLNTTKALKQAFRENPILTSLMKQFGEDEIVKRLHLAVNEGNTNQLEFGDIINLLMKDMRMPSIAKYATELPKGEKFSDYFHSLSGEIPNREKFAHLVLSSLGAEAFHNAVLSGTDDTYRYITTTFDNREYRLRFTSHNEVQVRDPNNPANQLYPTGRGVDNPKSFSGSLSENDYPRILEWFKDVVNPKMEDFDHFRENYMKYIDPAGKNKPGMSEETAQRYREIMRASNLLLMTFEGEKIGEKESSGDTLISHKLRNSTSIRPASKEYHPSGLYNADEIVRQAKGEGVPILEKSYNQGPHAGIYLSREILGKENANKILENRPLLLKAIFQTFTIDDLIAEGCIERQEKAPNINQTFFIISRLPQRFTEYLQAKQKDPQFNNLDSVIAHPFDFSRPEYRELLNPRAELDSMIRKLFPTEFSNRNMADVREKKAMEVSSDELVHKTMSTNFLHEKFMKEIRDPEGKVDQKKMVQVINKCLVDFGRYYSTLRPGEKKIPQKFVDIGIPQKTWTFNEIQNILKDGQKAETFSQAVREGFKSYDEEVSKEKMETLYKNWRSRLKPEDINTLREYLLKINQNKPAEHIDAVIEKVLPFWFGLGIDTSNGSYGIAAGVSHALKLGDNGEYGTIVFGGGVGVGKVPTGPGVAVNVNTVYKTPNLGPFAVFAGGGGAAGASESIGVGIGVGAGIEIQLPTIESTKMKAAIGVAYVPGMPFPIPGATFTFEKDNKNALQNLLKEMWTKLEFDKTDEILKSNRSAQEKKQGLANNTFFKDAYDKRNGADHFEKAELDTIINDYREYQHNAENMARSQLSPELILGLSSITIGFGIDPETGKFIFLVGARTITDKRQKLIVWEEKDQQKMDTEMRLEHLYKLSTSTDPKAKAEISAGVESGKLVYDADKKHLALLKSETRANTGLIENTGINDTRRLEKMINKTLKPLNLEVKYDENQKQYELLIKDLGNDTNYDLAVDKKASFTGLSFIKTGEFGKVYLSSNFDINHPPVILRADYQYPFPVDGKTNHTIITISDNPQKSAHDIYREATEIVSSNGGNWYTQNGMSYDRFSKSNQKQILRQPQNPLFMLDNKKIAANYPSNDPVTEEYIKALQTRGTIEPLSRQRSDQIDKFTRSFEKRFQYQFRKLSNQETKTNVFEDLNKLILREWKKTTGEKDLSANDLAHIRQRLNQLSYSELGDPNPDKRQKKFEKRLYETMQFIIKPRIANLIVENHKKYSSNDPNYIHNSAEKLATIIYNRAKEIQVNTDKGEVKLENIDRCSTVVGTLGILGFRGSAVGVEARDANEKMIGSSENYALALGNAHQSESADIARLIIEETSKLPDKLDLNAPLANQTKNIEKFLAADLSQKVISVLFHAEFDDLFRPGMRKEILRLASIKESLNAKSFNKDSTEALKNLQELVFGIRESEMRGQKEYSPLFNTNYIFRIKLEVHDGVYGRCTNYSMWINESFELIKKTGARYGVLAAYGLSAGKASSNVVTETTALGLTAAMAVKPKEEKQEEPIDKGGVPAGGKDRPNFRIKIPKEHERPHFHPPKGSPESPSPGEQGKVDLSSGGKNMPGKTEGTPQDSSGDSAQSGTDDKP